jgi:hypothetical protein
MNAYLLHIVRILRGEPTVGIMAPLMMGEGWQLCAQVVDVLKL